MPIKSPNICRSKEISGDYMNSPLVANLYNETFKFQLGQGNNPEIVRKVMKTRISWVECYESCGINFKWSQTHKNFKYDKLNQNSSLL